MIRSSDKIIDLVNAGNIAIGKIMYGARLVWELALGCFTKGYWLNNKRWTNDRGWKNE